MGFIGSVLRFIFTRLIPILILVVALIVGWLNTGVPIPEGKFFATVFPILKGKWPATIVGHGKMVGTPVVPDDMVPQPRPENELFVELPGGYQMPQNGIGMCCRPTAYDDVLVERTVLWYLLLGGRHIDTAHIYLNHEAIGKGIEKAIRRGSLAVRSLSPRKCGPVILDTIRPRQLLRHGWKNLAWTILILF